MKKALIAFSLTLVLLAALTMAFAPAAAASNPFHRPVAAGAVYTMTNDPGGNEVVAYDRMSDGTLGDPSFYSTQGTGSGGGFDPLVSQGSLVLTDNGRWLLAVNAGSNEITVFRVKPNGLEFSDKINSGGTMPTSLTVSFNRVYVLNAGGTPNITGFILGFNGQLHAIPGSTRNLSGGFSQVGFNNLGTKLVVIGRDQDEILVFDMHFLVPENTPVTTASSGATPFGLVFDQLGRLLVVEVNNLNGAVSSYRVNHNGSLDTISGSVASGEKAACWIARNNRGFVYTTNPGSSSISAYKENFRGMVTLLDAAAATGVMGLDEGVSNDGKYLYVLAPNGGGVEAYSIGHDGSLTSLGLAPAGLAAYAQGLAVK